MSEKRQWPVSMILLFIVVILLLPGCLSVHKQACCESPPRGCTIFTIAQGGRVFFGGNGDWVNFDSNYYWVDPGDGTHYGAIYFGKPDNVQQGFNEKGLAYDSNGLPRSPVTDHPGREPIYGGHSSQFIHILQACATVEEVIAWVQAHQWHEAMHYQMHFADAGGDAVVIGAGPDGRVTFTRKPAGDGFLVSTNFNLANPVNGSRPCWRYARAREILSEIDNPDALTAERAASVLDAVHVASPGNFTILSLVGDLPQGLVYIYLFHQFDAPIVLNIAEEIAHAPDPGPLRDRFPPETVRQVDRAYQRLKAQSARCNALGLVWVGMVLAALVTLLVLTKSKQQSLTFWVLVVIVLGPVGLLVWLIAARSHRPSPLVEVVGDLIPYIVGMVVALWTIVYVPAANQHALLQLIVFYGVPLVIGLFLYQGPVLALATKRRYPRMLIERLPEVVISTNFALAGLLAVGAPLTKAHLNHCGFSSLATLSWWAIYVLGASVGGILLAFYQVWAISRNYLTWSALSLAPNDATETVYSPTWRPLWRWILASYGALVVGIIAGVLGSTWVESIR